MSDPLPSCTPLRTSPIVFMVALLLMFAFSGVTLAQADDAFGEAADPVRLFERGQNAHARGDLAKALEFYEEAIKVRPEFPEAEFQRANVLVSLGRKVEAEAGFRRTIELKKGWSLPYSALGTLLVGLNRDSEAEPILRQALKLDVQNNLALRMLADIRLRAGDAKEALKLTQTATSDDDAPAATWMLRALAERMSNDKPAALASLEHILKLEPNNLSALMERAEIRIAMEDKPRALEDLAAAEKLIRGDKAAASRVAAAYDLTGKPEEARRIAQSAGLISLSQPSADGSIKVGGTAEEIEAANNPDPTISTKALESLLAKNPGNAMLMARLGAAYRTTNPARSLDFYRRALEVAPHNVDYATGYSSALVQARRFGDAIAVLRQVISAAPENYTAHANLATALYALKQYPQALPEYEWLLRAKPELTVPHYFIATAHDYLGEYDEALTAYELFLAHADPKTNQLEIEKVNLRLPSLRRQIKLGQGVKRKPGQTRKP
ncbi:MAG TPA: tetratricopeptide repeat protein [Pyrinomonadaceae bacterium]|nr:tetratricopeptide repeat protein [Pyrinomonadaceae bacterium]